MSDSRFQTFKSLLTPKLVKYSGGAIGTLAFYDLLSSQFGLLKLGKILGMSGSLLPWWGWLLILQGVFVFALFEYVRAFVNGKSETVEPVIDYEPKLEHNLLSSYEWRSVKTKVENLEIELSKSKETMLKQFAAVDQEQKQISAIAKKSFEWIEAKRRWSVLNQASSRLDSLIELENDLIFKVFDAFKNAAVKAKEWRENGGYGKFSDDLLDNALDGFNGSDCYFQTWAMEIGYEYPMRFDDTAYVQNPHKYRGEPHGLSEEYNGEYRRFVVQKEYVEQTLKDYRTKLQGEIVALNSVLWII